MRGTEHRDDCQSRTGDGADSRDEYPPWRVPGPVSGHLEAASPGRNPTNVASPARPARRDGSPGGISWLAGRSGCPRGRSTRRGTATARRPARGSSPSPEPPAVTHDIVPPPPRAASGAADGSSSPVPLPPGAPVVLADCGWPKGTPLAFADGRTTVGPSRRLAGPEALIQVIVWRRSGRLRRVTVLPHDATMSAPPSAVGTSRLLRVTHRVVRSARTTTGGRSSSSRTRRSRCGPRETRAPAARARANWAGSVAGAAGSNGCGRHDSRETAGIAADRHTEIEADGRDRRPDRMTSRGCAGR